MLGTRGQIVHNLWGQAFFTGDFIQCINGLFLFFAKQYSTEWIYSETLHPLKNIWIASSFGLGEKLLWTFTYRLSCELWVFIFLWAMPGSTTAESYDSCMFRFFKKLPNCFPSGRTISHSHQQGQSRPDSQHPYQPVFWWLSFYFSPSDKRVVIPHCVWF